MTDREGLLYFVISTEPRSGKGEIPMMFLILMASMEYFN
jgi:hypothetical protein